MERNLDVQNEWLIGNCGEPVGCNGLVDERELWSEIWIYRTIV